MFSVWLFSLIENALEGKIWINQIWFGYYLGEEDAKANSIPDYPKVTDFTG
jgi:hypothetical protein